MSSSEEALRKAISGDAAMLAAMAKAIYEKYGDEGLATMAKGLETTFTPLARTMGHKLGIALGKGQAEDWVKLDGYMGSGMDMESEFITVSPTSAFVRVTRCPYTDQVRRIFPDFCRKVLIGAERAIAHTVNPKMEPYGTKYIPEGDEICEIHCDLRP